jgi:hypothetical protein
MPRTSWSPLLVLDGADQTVYLVIDRFGGGTYAGPDRLLPLVSGSLVPGRSDTGLTIFQMRRRPAVETCAIGDMRHRWKAIASHQDIAATPSSALC